MRSLEITETRNLVYVVSHIGVPGIYKLGNTRSLRMRFSSLNSCSPYGMEIVHVQYSELPKVIESAILEKWLSNRLNGEWFALNDRELELLKLDLKIMNEIAINCNNHYTKSIQALRDNGFSVYSHPTYRYKPKKEIQVKWRKRVSVK